MPGSDDLSVALARLGMGRQKADAEIRPLLLRMVVDLFLQKRHHAPADLRSFEAIVAPLLADLDTMTRRRLIERLFDHPATPVALLDRLMDDESLIAADLYRHASCEEDGLLAAASTASAMVAVSIAQRTGLAPSVVQALVARPEARIATALADNASVDFAPAALQAMVARARHDRDLAERLTTRLADPLAVAPLFPIVSQRQRRRMIEAARRLDLGQRSRGRPDSATTTTLVRLNQLALAAEWESFDDTLCLALGREGSALRPLLHDGTGDVLALALAAVGVTGEIAARIFILGEPAIGRSITAVRRLTALVDTVTPTTARRLLDAMLGSATAPRRAATGMAAEALPSAGRRIEAVPAAPRWDVTEAALRRVRR